jgi:hypothetical protein
VRWTRANIIEEIRRLHDMGEDLSYSHAEEMRLNLLRAASWHYGTWRLAVQAAGLRYDEVSRYKSWGRDRVVERIQELHAQGADLSWRAISLQVDPALAAAALRPNAFSSWREALSAAGLNPDDVSRYRHWNPERVLAEIRELHAKGEPLSSKVSQVEHQSLFCAARRRFGSWDGALEAAGLDVSAIRLRKPSPGLNKPRRSRKSKRAKPKVRRQR